VGWLAIAGVPPFAGFWSKDDILANAFGTNHFLWAVGLITAVLTAYYMSRQVFLVFFGKERWKEASAPRDGADAAAEPEHEPAAAGGSHGGSHGGGAHGDFKPHESPWTMGIPLVVLAGLSIFGGALNLPFSGAEFLGSWLEPVFKGSLHPLHVGHGVEITLALATAGLCLVGVAVAFAVYLRGAVAQSSMEPRILRRAWYVDGLVAAIVETPGRALSNWSSSVMDRRIIDGAVNGVGTLVRAGGSRLRAVQSGYVRNYALAVVLGAVALLGYVVVRVGI